MSRRVNVRLRLNKKYLKKCLLTVNGCQTLCLPPVQLKIYTMQKSKSITSNYLFNIYHQTKLPYWCCITSKICLIEFCEPFVKNVIDIEFLESNSKLKIPVIKNAP